MAVGKLKLRGRSQLKDQEGDVLDNTIEFVIDEDGTSRVVADSPVPKHFRPPVESHSLDVAIFLTRMAVNLKETADITAYRNSKPLSDPKPKDRAGERYVTSAPPPPVVKIADRQMVQCPACDGEGWVWCDLCAGDSKVTKTAAQKWRIFVNRSR